MANEANLKVQEDLLNGVNCENEGEDFAQMLEEFEGSFRKKDSDSIIEGVIVEIKDDIALIDIGKKVEGKMNISELQDADGNLQFKPHDTISVVIVSSRGDGAATVSHKRALKKLLQKDFINSLTEDSQFEATVTKKNKGGYVLENEEGVSFFMPLSQSSFDATTNIIGKKLLVRPIKIDQENMTAVVSRKKILDEERRKKRDAINSILEQTEPVEGTIKKITTYGMFVDVGGVDGLVHYSEISYKGPVNPGTMYKEGEKVFVKPIEYDKQKRHLSLSIKATMSDPWKDIENELESGDVIKVTVSNIEKYGAFVDLGNDIEGFLHISEISWDKNIEHPKEYLNIGDEIDVEVIEIDTVKRKLRVSLKKLKQKPFEEFVKNHKIGDIIDGVVVSVTAFGAFIMVDKVEGLLHNEDATWEKSVKCKDIFKKGDEVKVKIEHIDTQKEKISLSRKELLESPAQRFSDSKKIGDLVVGVVKDIKDFGVFVELEDGIDALIKKEDLGKVNADDIKIGDSIEAAIVLIEPKKNRIRLSVRRLSKIKEREMLKEINKEDKMTLGDAISEKLNG